MFCIACLRGRLRSIWRDDLYGFLSLCYMWGDLFTCSRNCLLSNLYLLSQLNWILRYSVTIVNWHVRFAVHIALGWGGGVGRCFNINFFLVCWHCSLGQDVLVALIQNVLVSSTLVPNSENPQCCLSCFRLSSSHRTRDAEIDRCVFFRAL